MNHPPIEPLLDVNDVAAAAKVSPHTVRNWVATGSVPFLKVGGSVRFDRPTIESWLHSRRGAL